MNERFKIEDKMVIMDLIECFEEFLDKRGIVLENDEKQEDDDASNIYGTDYFELEESVGEVLSNYGVDVPGINCEEED